MTGIYLEVEVDSDWGRAFLEPSEDPDSPREVYARLEWGAEHRLLSFDIDEAEHVLGLLKGEMARNAAFNQAAA